MAAHIAHAALAERVFDTYFYKFNRRDFIIGALFPDIRLLGHVPREMTHFKKVSIENILKESSSFMGGLLYHSLVDSLREEWMIGNGIYDLMPYEYRWTQAIKLFEDRLYYNDIQNWDTISIYFSKVIPDELKFNMNDSQIMVWHTMLREYFKSSPDAHQIMQFANNIGMDEQAAIDINLHIEVIEGNKKIKALCQKFHDNYESILKDSHYV